MAKKYSFNIVVTLCNDAEDFTKEEVKEGLKEWLEAYEEEIAFIGDSPFERIEIV